ncbi:DUF899 domain-containing protein [Streptomyces pluripotens]|uniref:DUF899 domain-containing protein n=1 Tax=Streptomyces pluripotens TaxID=1355015 RepID=A0A221NVH0_9ACTN|nr:MULTISPECIES: DUF899 domain-containing protein [Streptomyces]ARP69705.1 hypothetical protein LK06_006795 [Streptomyces pluripotens]ASN23961.1 DUF899 domain-containing protein [Streptomyces pluripotens]KIE24169.1 hypothetical protein LK08_26760 [Streptomyces sp. MUSC 125]MCH0555857.1 DUF899 domain-containing protein [Streptomyces sp. MUM 16J]
MPLPEIVSREQWRTARQKLLRKEEAFQRAREALAADRQRLPMVEADPDYVFEGGDGRVSLLDLFEGRGQLVVHHFMFAPEWESGCPCCAAFLDQIGNLAHLRVRNTAFAAVSRAPFRRILPFKARMGWAVPWYSSGRGDFNSDFGATVESGGELVERPGVSCFLRDHDRVFHTYSVYDDGLDGLGAVSGLLDLTALGRSPAGNVGLRLHDEYDC